VRRAHVAGVALRDRRDAADAAEPAQQRLAEPLLARPDLRMKHVPEGTLVVKVGHRIVRVRLAIRVKRRQRPLLVARFMAPKAATGRVDLAADPRDVVPHLALADRAVADFVHLGPDG
jgi:hypothetical protein